MTIAAIETEYRGCRFRSRLEARWAVFFDALNMRWQYEVEGFELPSGRYLPDFYLSDQNLFIEVKGTDAMLHSDMPKLVDFTKRMNALVILGDVPDVSRSDGAVTHTMLRLAGDKVVAHRGAVVGARDCGWSFLGLYIDTTQGQLTQSSNIATLKTDRRVLSAYRTARRARFEFGQTPNLIKVGVSS